MEEKKPNLARQFWERGWRNLFIYGIILLVAWIVLVSVLPDGWAMAIVNITFLLASLIWGWFLTMAFDLVLPHWLSPILAGLLWALLFLGIRSLF